MLYSARTRSPMRTGFHGIARRLEENFIQWWLLSPRIRRQRVQWSLGLHIGEERVEPRTEQGLDRSSVSTRDGGLAGTGWGNGSDQAATAGLGLRKVAKTEGDGGPRLAEVKRGEEEEREREMVEEERKGERTRWQRVEVGWDLTTPVTIECHSGGYAEEHRREQG
ncbi:hypothetical protein HN51_003935 [Arachis hypogaea]